MAVALSFNIGILFPGVNTSSAADYKKPPSRSQPITKISSDWPKWISGAKQGIRNGVPTWVSIARLNGVKITGPAATEGRLIAPSLFGLIVNPMSESGAPKPLADGFMGAVSDAWQVWANSVRVPGLPWYPAFASWPGPIAPPTPNVPTPLRSLAQDFSGLAPVPLANSIKARIGDAANWPGGNEAINEFCAWFNAGFVGWLNYSVIRSVMGSGPVPQFAPPSVPVGPVIGGVGSDGRIDGAPRWP